MAKKNSQPASSEQAEKERIQRILDQRIQSQYGGTARKLKYNAGLQAKHKMTRNTQALPGWRDLPERAQGAIIGGGLGLGLSIPLFGLIDAALQIPLLAAMVALLVIIILAGVGFILGKVIEK